MPQICFCSSNIEKKGLAKYFELILWLVMTEQYNELLIKNHEIGLVGFGPLLEPNATCYNPQKWQRFPIKTAIEVERK